MWFVGIGTLMLLAKLADLAVMSHVAWWVVALPFGAAALWWVIADALGITQRRTMAAEAERAHQRRERQYESLGMRAPKGGRRTNPADERGPGRQKD